VIEERRKQFEAGQDWALLDAVDFCARAGMAMPTWLANAFCERYMAYHLFKAKTLDQAFGAKRPKHTQIGALAKREWLKPRVVYEVLRLRKDNVPFGEELFERVGEKLGIGKTLANEIYYDPENPWTSLPQIFEK
jgi:HD-like signal output (HDOD) protein